MVGQLANEADGVDETNRELGAGSSAWEQGAGSSSLRCDMPAPPGETSIWSNGECTAPCSLLGSTAPRSLLGLTAPCSPLSVDHHFSRQRIQRRKQSILDERV